MSNLPNSNNNGSNQRQSSGGGSGQQQQSGSDKLRQHVPQKVNDTLNKK